MNAADENTERMRPTYQKKSQFWRWTFRVITMVAAAGLGLLLWYIVERPKASITVTLSRSEIIAKASPEAQEFRLMWKDRAVERADVFRIVLTNDGNQVVERVDWEPPFAVTFPRPATIVLSSVSASREQLLPKLQHANGSVVLSPVRLDVGDSVTIDLTVVDAPEAPPLDVVAISGYVYGVGKIQDQIATEAAVSRRQQVVSGILGVLTGMISGLLAVWFRGFVRRRRRPTVWDVCNQPSEHQQLPTLQETEAVLRSIMGMAGRTHGIVSWEGLLGYLKKSHALDLERSEILLYHLRALGFISTNGPGSWVSLTPRGARLIDVPPPADDQ